MSRKAVTVALILGTATLATLAGTASLIDFETAPGRPPLPPAVWPVNAKIKRAKDRNQIVVVAHPQCGCTQATLRELSDVSGPALSVLVFRPNPQSDWSKDRIGQLVQDIPGATAEWDDAGEGARLFGSSTSGSVLLYGPNGNLLFHGGITQSRGHAGANRGLSQLKLAIQTGQPSMLKSPVFGCSLLGPGAST